VLDPPPLEPAIRRVQAATPSVHPAMRKERRRLTPPLLPRRRFRREWSLGSRVILSCSATCSASLEWWSGVVAVCAASPGSVSPRRASKPVSEWASSMSSSSGAAAHAVLLASAKLDALKDLLVAALPPGVEDVCRRRFDDECVADVFGGFLLPLRDAAKIPSCSYSRGGAAIRSGVVAAAAPSIQSFLKTFPPADDFFGYPTQQLAALMDFTVMVASLAPRAPAPRRPPPPRTAPPSRPQARSAPSSPTVVASSAASGRLQTFLDAWKDIRAPLSVLQIIEGCRFPFTRPPPLSLPSPHRSQR